MIRSSLLPQNRFRLLTTIVALLIALATACATEVTPRPTATSEPPTAMPSPSPTLVPTATPVPTPTPVPPKELTVCQSEEPNTLFIYGGPSPAARSVLDAVYDGPVGMRHYVLEPGILERLPSLERGDVSLRTVYVSQDELVLGVDGKVVELAPDVTVRNAEGVEVTFDGDAIEMTQMVVTFTLRSDVKWADGESLDAEDSRFSYNLAAQIDDASIRRRVDRTASYEMTDSHTVVWSGVPGYRDTYYMLNFYHPLPHHVMADATVDQLMQTDVVQRHPLGWGPFVVESWAEGDHITMARNPHYFRAADGLPHLDRVTVRFVGDAQRALEDMLNGACDIIAEDLLLGAAMLAPFREAAESEAMRLISAPSGEWEHLDFGIQPVPWSGKVAFFSDEKVRQAVAHCVDRERVAAAAFSDAEAIVAHSYVLPRHPLHAGEALRRWGYDPVIGRTLLDEAGWRDTDGDGIREAYDGSGVVPGTVFSSTLLTTSGDAARQRVAEILRQNLADCGVGLNVEYLPPDVFYADGPDGPVFGRQFDLALFSWLNGLDAPCALYVSGQIPSEENWWATSNNAGYASEAYDEACQSASNALYGTPSHARFHQEAQRIFSEDLPVLPLYYVPRWVAVGPRVEGVVLDPSQRSLLWNVESMDIDR